MFTSTRKKIQLDASQAILQGLSKDGGLLLPTSFNTSFFNIDLLKDDYNTLTKKVLKEYLNDYPKETISTIVDNAYNKIDFIPNPVIIKSFDDLDFLELFHGPTFAFKDMALSILPRLFNEAKKIQNINKKTIILTATSGDTGSAALSGFHNLEDTYVIVLYPKNGVSEFQEAQMRSFDSKNCFILGIDGNFDDCQRIVKDTFLNVEVKNSILSSANSINIGRILPQIVYYIYTYLDNVKRDKIQFGEQLNFTVPTGNFGNIYAAYVAKKMGLPIRKLIIASNENNVLTELFNIGTYNMNKSLMKTISPSMDILVSSNFERYLSDVINDEIVLSKYMDELKNGNSVSIKELYNQSIFFADYATEEETYMTIKSVFEKYKYIIDPHTAVAYNVARKYQEKTNDKTKMVIVSTASPYKFSDAVLDGLSQPKKDDTLVNIFNISKLDNINLDHRIIDVLSDKTCSGKVPLNQVSELLMKVIGEIDDKN